MVRGGQRGTPPDPTGWLSIEQATVRLDRTRTAVAWALRQGNLDGVNVGGRWWIRETSVDERLRDRSEWVSWGQAAEIIGCSHMKVKALAEQGVLESRHLDRRASISRASAEAYREVWAARNAARDARRRAKAEQAARVAGPDDGHVWLTTTTAALVAGITPGGLRFACEAGRVPFVEHGGRRWFRRDQLEVWAAARRFRAARAEGSDPGVGGPVQTAWHGDGAADDG